MKRTSQKDKILRWLLSGKKITTWIAIQKFGCTSLPKRICEIQGDFNKQCTKPADWMEIQKGWKKTKYSRVREYSL